MNELMFKTSIRLNNFDHFIIRDKTRAQIN